MTPALREREWQRQVLELAQILGWRTMHVRPAMGSKKHGWVTPTSLSGWPDLTLWHPKQKRVVFVELKTDRGRLTDGQREVLGSLLGAGQEVYVWRPSELDEVQACLSGPAS